MDKLPPRPDLPPQGTTASESKGKDAVGSDGRRGIRNQGANTNLGKTPSSSDVVKTALKDRLISKTADAVTKKTGVAINNLSKTMAMFQRAIKACAQPGYRVSKSEAVINSIKALKSIRKQLGDTGQELQLKSQLNDLLGTKIARGRVNMTLSDFGQISKLANTVADAPTMARMEKKTAELLTRALELLTDSAYSRSPKEYTPPVAEQKAQAGAFIGDKLEELFPEGVMPDLDAVDDSEPVINAKTVPEDAVIPTPLPEKAVIPTPPPPPPLPEKAAIPTPPPPPPLPEEQVADVSSTQSEPVPETKSQLEARRGFDAVIEELKQKLMAKGDPVESTNPDIMASSAQIPVDASVPWQAPDLAPVPKVDIKDLPVDSKGFRELGQPKAGSFKTVAGQKRHFSSIDSTSSDGERPLKRLRHGEGSLLSTAPVNNAEVRKAYGAVMDELKQKLSARGAPDTEVVASSEQDVSPAPLQDDLAKNNSAVHKELRQKPLAPAQSKNPQVETASAQGAVDTSEAQQAHVAMAKRAEASKGYDAVIEELKEKIRQRGGAFDPDPSPATEVVADVQASATPEERPDSATDEQMAALQEQAERNHADLKEALKVRRTAIDPDDPAAEPERNKKGSGESGQ